MNPECCTVIGGPHVSFTSRETLEECPYIDYVVRGEGELVFKELVNNMPEVSKILSISYRKNGEIIENADGGLITNLDEIPFPAYHLLPMGKYRLGGKRFAAIITSRGCSFRCIFCSSSNLYGRVWRARSPENVLEEIKTVAEYGVKEIEFLDDTFTLNQKRAMRICDLIVRENLDISWSCSSRGHIQPRARE